MRVMISVWQIFAAGEFSVSQPAAFSRHRSAQLGLADEQFGNRVAIHLHHRHGVRVGGAQLLAHLVAVDINNGEVLADHAFHLRYRLVTQVAVLAHINHHLTGGGAWFLAEITRW